MDRAYRQYRLGSQQQQSQLAIAGREGNQQPGKLGFQRELSGGRCGERWRAVLDSSRSEPGFRTLDSQSELATCFSQWRHRICGPGGSARCSRTDGSNRSNRTRRTNGSDWCGRATGTDWLNGIHRAARPAGPNRLNGSDWTARTYRSDRSDWTARCDRRNGSDGSDWSAGATRDARSGGDERRRIQLPQRLRSHRYLRRE